jgi:GrpB-like predicted nucleotidyltransferase (UPF0157 family)
MPVEIVEFREAWKSEFDSIAVSLRSAFGTLALRIDHIGSTAVQNLAAKDIIDIQITVAQLDDHVSNAMISAGYQRREHITCDHRPAGSHGPDSDWEKWFFAAPSTQRPTNTHLRIDGRPNQSYPLLFRDYLRAHPATAEAYSKLKRRLAENLRNPDAYCDTKDPAVDLIYLPAQQWAQERNWNPAPSDG